MFSSAHSCVLVYSIKRCSLLLHHMTDYSGLSIANGRIERGTKSMPISYLTVPPPPPPPGPAKAPAKDKLPGPAGFLSHLHLIQPGSTCLIPSLPLSQLVSAPRICLIQRGTLSHLCAIQAARPVRLLIFVCETPCQTTLGCHRV